MAACSSLEMFGVYHVWFARSVPSQNNWATQAGAWATCRFQCEECKAVMTGWLQLLDFQVFTADLHWSRSLKFPSLGPNRIDGVRMIADHFVTCPAKLSRKTSLSHMQQPTVIFHNHFNHLTEVSVRVCKEAKHHRRLTCSRIRFKMKLWIHINAIQRAYAHTHNYSNTGKISRNNHQ